MKSGLVKLKLVKEEDLELLMAWRSHPKIYKYFLLQKRPLKWEEHIKFWNTRKDRQDWVILLSSNNRWRKVGSVYVSNLSKPVPDLGIYIGEVSLHRIGLGSKALNLGINWLKNKGFKKVRARINKANTSSIKLFTKYDFKKKYAIHGGKELLYELNLD